MSEAVADRPKNPQDAAERIRPYRVSTGIAGLDSILDGGPAGVGKSTVGTVFLHAWRARRCSRTASRWSSSEFQGILAGELRYLGDRPPLMLDEENGPRS